MRAFVVLACVAMAAARPEPPVGYSYQAPGPRYSSASSYNSASLGHSGGHLGGLSHSSGLSLGHSAGGLSHGGLSHGGFSQGISQGGISQGGYISAQGSDSFSGGYAGGYSGAPLVQKHIYVHVPPPEPVEQRIPNIPAVAPPQKHYKIIFIKAPTPPTPTAPIIPVQPQNEEKTLVYVLVKKPEEQPDIVIPTPAPTQPSKPEVYFIKYQTQKENGGISSGIGSGISSGIGAGSSNFASSLSQSGVSEEASSSGITSFGGDEGAAEGGHASTQYGPPGHVAGPLQH
ncbi:FK506-binding protein 5 [Plutella xylostella]|uniref:FK506-binding protein 5 n=1 Tax=Plutella xylostella TaxID=51655 RepID=UPI00203276F3|nr:FK506-binding protein 5 [Plutella xylostella]